jgi:hypothetical protein
LEKMGCAGTSGLSGTSSPVGVKARRTKKGHWRKRKAETGKIYTNGEKQNARVIQLFIRSLASERGKQRYQVMTHEYLFCCRHNSYSATSAAFSAG